MPPRAASRCRQRIEPECGGVRLSAQLVIAHRCLAAHSWVGYARNRQSWMSSEHPGDLDDLRDCTRKAVGNLAGCISAGYRSSAASCPRSRRVTPDHRAGLTRRAEDKRLPDPGCLKDRSADPDQSAVFPLWVRSQRCRDSRSQPVRSWTSGTDVGFCPGHWEIRIPAIVIHRRVPWLNRGKSYRLQDNESILNVGLNGKRYGGHPTPLRGRCSCKSVPVNS